MQYDTNVSSNCPLRALDIANLPPLPHKKAEEKAITQHCGIEGRRKRTE